MAGFIFLGIILLILLWFIGTYNGFVKGKNLMREAWSGIDVQLKRRYDLIPNLVETVKGYSQHEKGLFEDVARWRSQSMSATTVKAKSEAEGALTEGLRSLFAVAEAYPELKANQNFMELQKSLEAIEDELQLARRYFNGTVRDFNIRVESFPSAMVASLFNFKTADYFEVGNAAEREVPQVKF
ncbi:MAG TPA: LemA family protein [Bacillota bacterium]|nr:LemA family protein [Bacillota bacterium]